MSIRSTSKLFPSIRGLYNILFVRLDRSNDANFQPETLIPATVVALHLVRAPVRIVKKKK